MSRGAGILGLEWYAPASYVAQEALEVEDGCQGKYVVGLGQSAMAFVDDQEDVGSILLTACARLLDAYQVDPNTVGRLEVGTETLVDKSKSIKTTLLRLFGESHGDIEGATVVNACYGGTAALLNAVAWVESSAWEPGQVAVVCCGDVAVYERGPARPSGGCGAVAILIGANAPLRLDAKRATCAMDVWDFYKPAGKGCSEYAAVDGKLSQKCYLESVDGCWSGLRAKSGCSLSGFKYAIFHAPYNKLVRKGFARLALNDDEGSLLSDDVKQLAAKVDNSVDDKALDAALRDATKKLYEDKVAPSTSLPRSIGNTYTASLYCGLVSLVATGKLERDDRILMFSYGSGSLATMFSLTVADADRMNSVIKPILNLDSRLADRVEASASEFHTALELRERACAWSPKTSTTTNGVPPEEEASTSFVPAGRRPVKPGVFRLVKVDDKYRRSYERVVE